MTTSNSINCNALLRAQRNFQYRDMHSEIIRATSLQRTQLEIPNAWIRSYISSTFSNLPKRTILYSYNYTNDKRAYPEVHVLQSEVPLYSWIDCYLNLYFKRFCVILKKVYVYDLYSNNITNILHPIIL